ncbi:unnamed protein product [Prunus armeniaca]
MRGDACSLWIWLLAFDRKERKKIEAWVALADLHDKMGRDGRVRLEIAGVSGMRDNACSLDVCFGRERKKIEEQSMKLKDSRGEACLPSVCSWLSVLGRKWLLL